MPPIPGMRTSSIRQSALASWSEAKNSSAEANALTANPSDLSNPERASRTDSSSSTTEIRWTATKEDDHFLRQVSIIPWYKCGRIGRVSPRPPGIQRTRANVNERQRRAESQPGQRQPIPRFIRRVNIPEATLLDPAGPGRNRPPTFQLPTARILTTTRLPP